MALTPERIKENTNVRNVLMVALVALAAFAGGCGGSGDGRTTAASREVNATGPATSEADGGSRSRAKPGGGGGLALAERVRPCELVLEDEAEAVVGADLRPGQPTVFNGTPIRQCTFRGTTSNDGRVVVEFDAFATTRDRFERLMQDSVAASKLHALDGVGQAAFFVEGNLGSKLVALHPNGLLLTVRVDGVPPERRPPVEKFVPAINAGFGRMPNP